MKAKKIILIVLGGIISLSLFLFGIGFISFGNETDLIKITTNETTNISTNESVPLVCEALPNGKTICFVKSINVNGGEITNLNISSGA